MKPFFSFLLLIQVAFIALAQSPMETFTKNLADCYAINDQKCVTEVMKQYVEDQKKAVGTEHEAYQGAILTLAMQLINQGQATEANPYIRETIRSLATTIGPESEKVREIGWSFLKILDSKATEERFLLEKWLAEQFPNLPPSHWGITVEQAAPPSEKPIVEIDIESNLSIDQLLALLENSTNEDNINDPELLMERIIPLSEKIIEKIEKEQKGRHPRYLEILNFTANAYTLAHSNNAANAPEKYISRSNDLIDKALLIVEKSVGRKNEDYLMLLNSKGSNFMLVGEHAQYIGVLKEMLELMESYLPKDDEFYQQMLQMYMMLAPLYSSSKSSEIISRRDSLSDETKAEMPMPLEMVLFVGEQSKANNRAMAVIPKIAYPNVLDSFQLFPQNRDFNKIISFLNASLNRMNPDLLKDLDDVSTRLALGFLQEEFEAILSFIVSTYKEIPALKSNLLQYILQFSYLNQVVKERLRQRLLLEDNPKYAMLFREWTDQKSKINHLYKQIINKTGTTKLDVIPEEDRLRDLETQLTQAINETYSLPTAPVWETIRNQLKQGEAFVEIKRFLSIENAKWTNNPSYIAMVLRHDSKEPDLVVLDNAKTLDYELFKAYQNSRFYGDSGNLYQRYFEPIRQYLQGVTRVYLSPDGVYHKINLNTLKIPGSNDHLVNQLDIQLVSSMLTLTKKEVPEATIASALLIGDPLFEQEKTQEKEVSYFRSAGDAALFQEMKWDPLPWSAIEVKKIDTLLQQKGIKTHTYLRDKALKSQLVNHSDAGIIHLATHGWFSPLAERIPFLLSLIKSKKSDGGEYPAMGNLLLSDEWSYISYDSIPWDEETAEKLRQINSEIWSDPTFINPDLNSGVVFVDDILTAFEIYGMNLRQAQVVVLSACNSGVSDLANGKGIAGLKGAFEVAGANYIINTLWQVRDDVAQAFMVAFYENWLGKSQSISTAFRNAQLQIRADILKEYPNHYRADLWGAFVLIKL